MRYFFAGSLLGIIINFFILSPSGPVSIVPEFTSAITSLDRIEKAPLREETKGPVFPVKTSDVLYRLSGAGNCVDKIAIGGMLTGFSGNGEYYVKYEKTGKEIEFFNTKGERFWKLKSMEYPYLSYEGKLLFLMNGDHSSVRILDYNGNEIGVKKVSGRLCTVIAFAESGNAGAIGFMDGSYYVLDHKGEIIASGVTGNGTMVKGLAVSGSGEYAALHYGNGERDYLLILRKKEGEVKTSRLYELPNVHVVKTAMHVTNDGTLTFLDTDRLLLVARNGKLNYGMAVPAKRDGQCNISEGNGFLSLSYTTRSGESLFMFFRADGTVLFRRTFSGESFLAAQIINNVTVVRGSDNLYCYSLRY